MKAKLAFPMLAFALAAWAVPIAAHHSVSAMFDVTKEITMQGVVTRIEWLNPHARLHVDVRNGDGTVSNWELELPPPNALKRENGNLDFIKPGDAVTAKLWQEKNGTRLAHVLTLITPDGRVREFPRSWGPETWTSK
jgi:hypothetical protein